MRDKLDLFFPQWQGATKRQLYTSALALHATLADTLPFSSVAVDPAALSPQSRGIVGYSQITQHLVAANSVIAVNAPQRIFTLGGDCSVDIAPIAWLNTLYNRDLAVLWIDAHGDLNTPASSPSHHFHGMPLRTLLGDGDRAICDLVGSRLDAPQVFLVGTRDLDPAEADYVVQAGISLTDVETVSTHPDAVVDAIRQRGYDHIHIHLDLDVLDPAAFPFVSYPTPDGITVEALLALLAALRHNFATVGATVAEFVTPDPYIPADLLAIIAQQLCLL